MKSYKEVASMFQVVFTEACCRLFLSIDRNSSVRNLSFLIIVTFIESASNLHLVLRRKRGEEGWREQCNRRWRCRWFGMSCFCFSIQRKWIIVFHTKLSAQLQDFPCSLNIAVTCIVSCCNQLQTRHTPPSTRTPRTANFLNILRLFCVKRRTIRKATINALDDSGLNT